MSSVRVYVARESGDPVPLVNTMIQMESHSEWVPRVEQNSHGVDFKGLTDYGGRIEKSSHSELSASTTSAPISPL